ncbi:hypothetical protein RSSE_p1326 (plasmid) [Ralstonia solanacearum]|nr:hypothetical protein RSSE_p1326 [Ralstonia solanacearum]
MQLSEYEVPAGTASLRRFVQCPAGCGTDYDGDELSDIPRQEEIAFADRKACKRPTLWAATSRTRAVVAIDGVIAG